MSSTIQGGNPYVGPRAFLPGEESLFFGRNREINDLVNLIFANNVVLLYAQSGAGKTSLLNVGVMPQFTREGHQILQARIQGIVEEPEGIANYYVFKTLVNWSGANPDTLQRFASMSFVEFLDNHPFPLDEDGDPLLCILVFDQFEELFTTHIEHWKDREGFFKQLAEAVNKYRHLRIMFVMREEYIARLDQYMISLPGKLWARFYLKRLDEASALNAIKEPLKNTNRSFAPDVAEELVKNLLQIRVESDSGEVITARGEFVEPVQLQVVCQSLWDDLPLDVTIIQSEQLKNFGDVNQVLSRFYEKSIKVSIDKTKVNERALRNWFETNLITAAKTRGIVFRGRDKTAGIPNTAVDTLVDTHLIRVEVRAGARWYELTHDRFIDPILQSNKLWHQKHNRIRNIRIASAALAMALIAIVALIALVVSQAQASAEVKNLQNSLACAASTCLTPKIDTLNIYTGCDTGEAVLTQVSTGDILTEILDNPTDILDRRCLGGQWKHLRTTDNIQGYALTEYLQDARVLGIDVWQYDREIDWQAVKQSGVGFAFVRATRGTSQIDSQFAANWQGMKDAGVIRGAYHVIRSSEGAQEQAANFLNVVQLSPDDLPPVLDIEPEPGRDADTAIFLQVIKNWIEVVEQKTGRKPIIYSAPNFLNSLGAADLGKYPLWVANYGVTLPNIPMAWSNWTFWQYTNELQIPSVNGPVSVDGNWFNGTLKSLEAFIKSG